MQLLEQVDAARNLLRVRYNFLAVACTGNHEADNIFAHKPEMVDNHQQSREKRPVLVLLVELCGVRHSYASRRTVVLLVPQLQGVFRHIYVLHTHKKPCSAE